MITRRGLLVGAAAATVAGAAATEVAFGAGGHTPAYWRSVASDGLRFLGRALGGR